MNWRTRLKCLLGFHWRLTVWPEAENLKEAVMLARGGPAPAPSIGFHDVKKESEDWKRILDRQKFICGWCKKELK